MIRITDAAEEYFFRLLSKQEPGTQIRVFVINPGMPNAECGVSYCPIDAVEDNDIKLVFKRIFAYVDQLSSPYLQDAEIDIMIDSLGSQLILKAPHVKMCRVNNNAPLIERVRYFLQVQINSKLLSHGGQVRLTEITSDMFVILQFGGGCNGCSMVDYTLKEVVEKKLLKKFPEIKGVRDLTAHQHGKHSYC